MTKDELITALKGIEGNPRVKFIYDGRAYCSVDHVYKSTDGLIKIAQYGETLYGYEDRPIGAPDSTEDYFFRLPSNPKDNEDDF